MAATAKVTYAFINKYQEKCKYVTLPRLLFLGIFLKVYKEYVPTYHTACLKMSVETREHRKGFRYIPLSCWRQSML